MMRFAGVLRDWLFVFLVAALVACPIVGLVRIFCHTAPASPERAPPLEKEVK